MTTDTSLDVSALEALDFAVPCGHSQHQVEVGSDRHGGEATHVAVSYHDCPERPDRQPPHHYPCCTRWADYVQSVIAQDRLMRCPRCNLVGYWSDHIAILGPL